MGQVVMLTENGAEGSEKEVVEETLKSALRQRWSIAEKWCVELEAA